MNIRAYQSSDYAEWLRMRRALWPEIPRETEVAEAMAWLACPDAVVFVAVWP